MPTGKQKVAGFSVCILYGNLLQESRSVNALFYLNRDLLTGRQVQFNCRRTCGAIWLWNIARGVDCEFL